MSNNQIPRLAALLVLTFLTIGCKQELRPLPSYKSEALKIYPVSEHALVHETYLHIPFYGFFPCNGLIYVSNGEAMVFDTPTEDSVSVELINWIEQELKCKITGVVANHFHIDCIGGLGPFHEKNISSYGNKLTIELADSNETKVIPQIAFDKNHELSIGRLKVINQTFGAAHTRDNIVSYFPTDQVLFGGCQVKAVDAGKGNLEDAKVQEWANTIQKIKATYPDLKYIIPGHGKVGGMELLDFTIALFSSDSTTVK